jgi:DNA polymerase V
MKTAKLQQSPSFSAACFVWFPIPADEYAEQSLDLNELVISHPAATFYVQVIGHS